MEKADLYHRLSSTSEVKFNPAVVNQIYNSLDFDFNNSVAETLSARRNYYSIWFKSVDAIINS